MDAASPGQSAIHEGVEYDKAAAPGRIMDPPANLNFPTHALQW
jgi:hypothetical protein